MIYQISSGQGPAECELGVAKFLAYLQKHYKVTVLETSPGYYENTYRSVRIQTDIDLSQFIGLVQWVCQSPYRPDTSAKTGFWISAAVRRLKRKFLTRNRCGLKPSAAVVRVGRM